MTARLALALLLLPALLPAQKATRCLPAIIGSEHQFRRIEQFGGNVTVSIGGGVRFRCQGQNVYVGGDSVQIINDQIYLLIGHAFYRDTTISVAADTLTYYKKAANPQQDETIQARRAVKVTDRKTGSTLTAPSVDFLRAAKGVRDSDDVQATGRPVVRYLPTTTAKGATPPKAWTITAEHLRGFGQSRLWGGGTVVVDRDSLRVNSDSIDVESNKTRIMKFIGKPATLKRSGKDSILISGKLIRLGFTGDTLNAVRAAGEGSVVRSTGTIKGDSILIAYQQERVTRTDVWGTGGHNEVQSSGYHSRGDSIVIETPDEKLRGLRAFRNAQLVLPPDSLHPIVIDSSEGGPPDPDTFFGNRVLVNFEERDSAGTPVTRISQVRALGKASLLYAYNAGDKGENCPTLTYSKADTIIVRMKPGVDSTGIADVRYSRDVHFLIAEKASVASADTTRKANPCRRARKP